MSFLASLRTSSRQAMRSSFAAPASTFHTSAARRLHEDDKDQDRDNLSEHYEAHKQENLKRTKEGKGKWTAELASNSEENVKADRGEYGSESIETLQQQTKHAPREKHD
ncbi:uncharacterized protein N7515_009585 [Penicillium bovifimosum]|uniref:Uncharacterized protein n=1 Tax=Penicillium bovifimosum TaxID=126998 RepID=A0A9W9GJT3_9EURO|nr:uncharacterized protein N7515_009585 [Penicillium bovifimosum]KAJ5121624.1 hypothetical protein N7515_009585 [Penicillium bovifimosum]